MACVGIAALNIDAICSASLELGDRALGESRFQINKALLWDEVHSSELAQSGQREKRPICSADLYCAQIAGTTIVLLVRSGKGNSNLTIPRHRYSLFVQWTYTKS